MRHLPQRAIEHLFKMLNMSSIDDLTTAARIRQAAVEAFGERGFERTTVRQVAERAGVSPGLVMHHFGSKDGLRSACDDWVMSQLREERSLFLPGQARPSIRTFLDDQPEYRHVMAYLVAALREGGAVADQVFERLHATTEELLTTGEKLGVIRPLEHRSAAIAYLVAASCGVMLLGRQFARAVGGAELTDPDVVEAYGLGVTSLLTTGLFTPGYHEQLRGALVEPPAQPSTHSPDPEEKP